MSLSNRFIYLASFLLSTSAFAATLRARVDRTSLAANQSVNLQLEFSDGNTAVEPDLEPLANDFQIVGQGQSTDTKVVNGRVSSRRVWNLRLQPKHEGQINIPSITAGGVASAPIELRILHAPADSSPVKGVSFTAKAAKKDVYKGERVRVDYVLRSQRDLQNLQPPELNLANAIVERIGEPKVVGQSVRFSYFITPMKEGTLSLPPLTLQGEMAKPAGRTSGQDPFADFPDDDQNDAFAQMRSMMKRFTANADVFQGFAHLQPVTLTSPPLALNVLPPVAGVVPWLPANNISLDEKLASNSGQVGEPLELTIHEEATGISPAQLPALEEQLSENADFKVYPEQAQDSQNARGDSVRDQKFTLIPQKSGSIQLPAIKVQYFDPSSHARKTAALPARTLSVVPGRHAPALAGQNEVAKAEGEYPVVAGVGVLALALMSAACFFLWRKRGALPEVAASASTVQRPHLSLKDLKNCKTTVEIQNFLQAYAAENWALPAHSSLGSIFAARATEGMDRESLRKIKKLIEADLYAGRGCDVAQLKVEVEGALSSLIRRAGQGAYRAPWPELNPV